MRVISGSARGISLRAVPGTNTRPTTDKVKEAMFSRIGPYFDGGLVLDLFAGTGGLGIEALSRGMERGVFIDRSRQAIQVIRHNLLQTKLLEQAEVYVNDAQRALKALAKRKVRFDVIFIDPPYADQSVETLLTYIVDHELLNDEATVVVEHDAKMIYKEQYGAVQLQRQLQFGDIAISFYKIVHIEQEVKHNE